MKSVLKKWFKRNEETEVFADLDSLVTTRVPFRFNGKAHYIKPLSVVEFAEAVNALAAIDLAIKKETLSNDEVMNAYEGIFKVVIEGQTIRRKEIESMNASQVAALYNLVLECIMGKAQVQLEKKNSSKPTEKS